MKSWMPWVSILLLGILCNWNGCDISDLKKNQNYNENNIQINSKRIDSLFYEFADNCTWIKLDKENMKAVGIPLARESDNRPVEVVRLYACMNYKDYLESKNN